MARKLHSRICIEGTLVAQTALHVGGMGGDADVDLALAADGKGRFYLPGTGLAGPLQAWMRRRAPKDADVDTLWGYQTGSSGHASFLLVEDSPLGDADSARPEVRDGVGIDRLTGAAASGKKYDRAVLPRGTQIPFKMLWERPVDKSMEAPCAEALVADLLAALERGDIPLGASKTRGLGRVKLNKQTKPHTHEQVLDTFGGMLATLRGKATDVTLSTAGCPLNPIPRLDIKITWRPCGPLMVQAEQEGIFVDGLPLVSGTEDRLAPVLPGSGIKGALRAHAERIVRTCRGGDSPPDLLHQVDVPLVTALFGAAGAANDPKDVDAPNLPPLLGLSALSADDCYADARFTQDQWQAITRAVDLNALQGALTGGRAPNWRQAMHVAIDRWTGGAADGLLYSILEPRGLNWEPLRLRLDLGRLTPDEQAAALALLFLLLRDVVRGEVPLGFGTNHGMGTIEVTDVTVDPHDLSALPPGVNGYGLTLSGGALTLPAAVQADLQTAWKKWLADNPHPAPTGGAVP